MDTTFIEPNWHPLILHFPLALIAAGILLELLGMFRNGASMRVAGRWMLLLGSFTLVPTLTTGLHAFREALGPLSGVGETRWVSLSGSIDWSEPRWHHAWRHLQLNLLGSGLILLTTLFWVARPWRVRAPMGGASLLLVIVGYGILLAGSWHGGESVYRQGLMVGPREELRAPQLAMSFPGEPDVASDADRRDALPPRENEAARPHRAGTREGGSAGARGLEYFMPPLQLHLFLAGLTASGILFSLALSLRKASVRARVRREMVADRVHAQRVMEATAIEGVGSLWFVTLVFGLLAMMSGAWSVMGTFDGSSYHRFMDILKENGHQRLYYHATCGLILMLAVIATAGLTSLFAVGRGVTSLLALAVLALLGAQVWMGTLLLFDSHDGPLNGFSTRASAHPSDIRHDLRMRVTVDVEDGERPESAARAKATPERRIVTPSEERRKPAPSLPPTLNGKPLRRNRAEEDTREPAVLRPSPAAPAEPAPSPAAVEPSPAPLMPSAAASPPPATLPSAAAELPSLPPELQAAPDPAVTPVTGSVPVENGRAFVMPSPGPKVTTVTMTNDMSYMPDVVHVDKGDTVVWVNASLLEHTVTADPEAAMRREHSALPPGGHPFHSGNIPPGGSYRFTFDVPGTYKYFCTLHESAGMLGTVQVEDR